MVHIRYARRPTHALKEYGDAFRAASRSGDGRTASTLEDLQFDFVLDVLGSQSAAECSKYLRSRKVWKTRNGQAVFKSAGLPCVAFSAVEDGAGETGILVLGFFSGPAVQLDRWWNEVVIPRLEAET